MATSTQGDIIYVQILAGATGLSTAFNVHGRRITHIEMPGTWVAAGLTFKAGADGTTLQDLYDNAGAEVAAVVSASKTIELPTATRDALQGANFLQLRSGTSGTPVNQTATRVLKLYTEKT